VQTAESRPRKKRLKPKGCININLNPPLAKTAFKTNEKAKEPSESE
jgi:hypothetical protein